MKGEYIQSTQLVKHWSQTDLRKSHSTTAVLLWTNAKPKY